MQDALMESPEDKIERLQRELGERNLELRKYAKDFDVLREMAFGAKQRIDRVVVILEEIGGQKYSPTGGYDVNPNSV